MTTTDTRAAKPPLDWNRAAGEFELSAVMWHALADSSLNCSRPEYGHLATDFGGQISSLYRQMAQVAESFAAASKEIAFAEAHPDCEGDCQDTEVHEHNFCYDDAGRMRCACGTYLFQHAPDHPYGSQPGPGGRYARWCLRDDCSWRETA